VQGNYLEAECVDVDPVGKSITCRYNKPFRGHSNEFTGREFNVPYDVLVVAVSLPAINFV
jgi:NADH dehydrogenase FAD-containing subunit